MSLSSFLAFKQTMEQTYFQAQPLKIKFKNVFFCTACFRVTVKVFWGPAKSYQLQHSKEQFWILGPYTIWHNMQSTQFSFLKNHSTLSPAPILYRLYWTM